VFSRGFLRFLASRKIPRLGFLYALGMSTKQPSKLTEPGGGDQQIRRALRRFFAAVDNALHAAEAAQRERESLERITGTSISDTSDSQAVERGKEGRKR
jgi:hypothetical protein